MHDSGSILEHLGWPWTQMNVTIGFPTSENPYEPKIKPLAKVLSDIFFWIEFGTLRTNMDSNGCYQSISHPRKPQYTKNDRPSSFPG